MRTIVSAALSPFNLPPFWRLGRTDQAQCGFVGFDGFTIRLKSVAGTTAAVCFHSSPRGSSGRRISRINRNICEGHGRFVQDLWVFSLSAGRSGQREMAAPVFGLLSSELCFHSALFKLPPGCRFRGKMKPPFPTKRVCITRRRLNKRKDVVIPRQRWNRCNKLGPSKEDGEDLLRY